MQFASSKSKQTLLAKDEKASRLNLYLDAPRGDVSLEEFTEMAVTRFNGRQLASYPPCWDLVAAAHNSGHMQHRVRILQYCGRSRTSP